MAKITIITEGIGLIYHKDDIWRVLYPTDECHKVNLKIGNGEEIPLGIKGKERRVVIKPTKGVISGFREGDNYNRFLDLTDDEAHSEGIELKQNGLTDTVLLFIENAEFSVNELLHSRFELKEGNKTKINSGIYGYSGKAVIEAEEVTITVEGDDGFSKPLKSDLTISFDNDCSKNGEQRETSDLNMLYEVIKDPTNPNRKFAFERDIRDQFKGNPGNISILAPFDTNVLPGRKGLPCNKFIASKSGDLP